MLIFIITILAVGIFLVPFTGKQPLFDHFLDWLEEGWSNKKLPEGMVQCDLCDDVCDKTGLHFDGRFKRHKLHILRKRWGQPLFQSKYKELKKQREKIEAARIERAAYLKNLQELEIDADAIMTTPVGEHFVNSPELEDEIEAALESLNRFTVKDLTKSKSVVG